MRITEFEIYKDLLKDKSGLVLSHDKTYLLESRLGPIAKKWGYTSLEAMTMALNGVPDKNLVSDIVEAMATGETSFFRDGTPFEIFKDTVMPYLEKARGPKKPVKIWCAGASTGQEPYSLAITIKENAPHMKAEIFASDISDVALDQARNAVYSQLESQRGLSIQLLLKHFTQDNNKWKLKDDIRKMVRFDYKNLMDSFTKLPVFDVIFCRNVLSCFDDKTKKTALEKMTAHLEKDGFLFLGKSETVLGITEAFRPGAKPGVFVLKDSPHQTLAA